MWIFYPEPKLAQVDKARSWFNRAVLLEPDCGDFWALLYKFEAQHGTPETQAGVLERLKAAEPRHGERWQRVSKDPANAHAAIEAILKKVVADLDKEPPP
jgi:pre-mRNA-processing factor 6